MRQILCDHCGEPIDPNEVLGDEVICFAVIGTLNKNDVYWREYHRRCARNLSVAEVWARPGIVPL